jgi:hypothetical protein
MDTTSGNGAYKTGTIQLRLQAGEDALIEGSLAPVSGVYKVKDNGDNYVQEWILPWAELSEGMDPAWDQAQFKFDVQVANATADGERTQQMFWNDNSDLQWNNTTHFGIVKLMIPVHSLADLMLDLDTEKSFVCGGDILLNPMVVYNGSGTLTYSWTPSDGLNFTDIKNPLASPVSEQMYTLTVTSPDFGAVKDSIMVIVNPLTANVNDINISCGSQAQLNLTTNYSGIDGLEYTWSPSDGLNASDIANPVATVTGETEYSVEIRTSDGCIANDNSTIHVSGISYSPTICMVTVDENDKNVVVINKDINENIDAFFIYRESKFQTDQYDLVGLLPFSENAVFVDPESNAKVQSNKYKIAVKDICGFITDKSTAHKTMHLTINQGSGGNWNLIWEPYS